MIKGSDFKPGIIADLNLHSCQKTSKSLVKQDYI